LESFSVSVNLVRRGDFDPSLKKKLALLISTIPSINAAAL
jgi:hypothetical protein